MIIHSDDYKATIHAAWQDFVTSMKDGHAMTPSLRACVRNEIYDAWLVSFHAGVNPFVYEEEKVAGQELEDILSANASLIKASKEYIESLYTFLQGYNFVVMLTDKNGVILYVKQEVDSVIKTLTDGHKLAVGSIRSDEYAGSNAMGTCLRLDTPIQYWGEEHYSTFNHPFICSAAPIHNPDGEIIGSLDITGPKEELNSITLSIVVSAVEGIERVIRLQEKNKQFLILNNQLNMLLQQMPYGVLSLNQDRIITQFNAQALKLLKLQAKDLHLKPLSTIVGLAGEEHIFSDIFETIQDKSLEFHSKYGQKISLSVSSKNVSDDKGGVAGVLLIFQELRKMHATISRMSGFTAKYTFDSIIGNSAATLETKDMAMRAAKGDSNVLIVGESGTGKELYAQAIHNASSRSEKPFIAINCGSLPRGLIESELFGYERGAFTGANRDGSPGKFELADEGTIFLDEIGNMALDAQATLLRVIQTREILRIGSNHVKKIDVRIIAATNVNLETAISEHSFRNDLYYRLNVMTIELSPLRDRKEDIHSLVFYFMKSFAAKNNILIEDISEEAMKALTCYHWPGNARELENVIERAANLCTSPCIECSDLPKRILEYNNSLDAIPNSISAPAAIQNLTKRLIEDALTRTNGNVSKAANLLRISRRTLHYRINKYELDAKDFRK